MLRHVPGSLPRGQQQARAARVPVVQVHACPQGLHTQHRQPQPVGSKASARSSDQHLRCSCTMAPPRQASAYIACSNSRRSVTPCQAGAVDGGALQGRSKLLQPWFLHLADPWLWQQCKCSHHQQSLLISHRQLQHQVSCQPPLRLHCADAPTSCAEVQVPAAGRRQKLRHFLIKHAVLPEVASCDGGVVWHAGSLARFIPQVHSLPTLQFAVYCPVLPSPSRRTC